VTASTTFSIESAAGGNWSANVYTSQYAGTWKVTGTYNTKSDDTTLTVTAGSSTRFLFNTISSPQTAGVAFSITIRAVDQYGNTVTTYTGTAKDYYHEVSYNNFTLDGTAYGWYTSINNKAYYGYSNGDQRAAILAKEAAQAADAIVDFSQYDNDHDGEVDCFTCIHAGYGTEESGSGKTADIVSHTGGNYDSLKKDDARRTRAT
jgi:hypothetical protein